MKFYLGEIAVIWFVSMEQAEALINAYNDLYALRYPRKAKYAKLIYKSARRALQKEERLGMKLLI